MRIVYFITPTATCSVEGEDILNVYGVVNICPERK